MTHAYETKIMIKRKSKKTVRDAEGKAINKPISKTKATAKLINILNPVATIGLTSCTNCTYSLFFFISGF